MKIAIIGNGLIGSISSIYLSKKGYKVDCIGPELKKAKEKIKGINKETTFSKYNSKEILVSPKFKRKDVIENKRISDNYFEKDNHNFFSLEIADEMGLSKFWGANLPIHYLEEFISNLDLNEEENKFLLDLIPMLNVQDYYKNKFPKFKSDFYKLRDKFEINSSILSIFQERLDINNLPNYKYSNAIFGSDSLKFNNCKRIKGKVERINLTSEKFLTEILIDDGNRKFHKKYNYVFLASGTIGSYRILMNSLGENRIYKLYDRIKHHPMISTLTFIPHIPYPKSHIGMSNLDLKLSIDKNEIVINFHPLESFLKNKFISSFDDKKFLFLKFIFLIIDKFSSIPFSPIWLIRRMYIAAIYLPSNLSSSYIGYENQKVKIIGGLRSDFEKYVMKNLWGKISKELKTKKIFNLFINPLKLKIGADFHYSSSLVNYTDKNGIVKVNNKKTNLIVLDPSSSKDLPIANPSLFFISRAIKMLREI